MQHDWSMTFAVSRDVVKIELFGEIEITLNGRKLPRPSNCVLHVDVDFRTIKRRVGLFHCIVQAVPFQRSAQGIGCLVPNFIGTDVLLGVFRGQMEGEVVESEGPQYRQNKIQQGGNLISELLCRHI